MNASGVSPSSVGPAHQKKELVDKAESPELGTSFIDHPSLEPISLR